MKCTRISVKKIIIRFGCHVNLIQVIHYWVGATLAVAPNTGMNIAIGAMTANKVTARVAPTIGDMLGGNP
ncbi:hypothetical protein EZS27_010004 [termite gut metagenome]|uniref:Uncharacterized protein n=1 Tax=termite gut metagenome TaxID=433724 RepID=A0A5J4S8Q4_9ZZZZ